MALLKVWADTQGGGHCRSCNAPITWYQLATGKRMPFDGDPVFVKTERDDESGRLIGVIDTEVDKSHFATCPQSKDWRKPR